MDCWSSFGVGSKIQPTPNSFRIVHILASLWGLFDVGVGGVGWFFYFLRILSKHFVKLSFQPTLPTLPTPEWFNPYNQAI